MITFQGLEENFKFISLEVANQIKATTRFLNSPSHELYDKIVSRDDYIDNLKNIVENNCFSKIHTDKRISKKRIDEIRSIHIICVNLERIADFCVNIVRQVGYLSDPKFLHRFDYKSMMTEIRKSVSQILSSHDKQDLGGALSICRSEYTLDQMYKANFDRVMAELGAGQNMQDYITVLFMFRYLERIGDSLLNIGEALLFSIIGEKVRIEQFQALQQSLTNTGFKGSISDIDFQSIWGTRSGCRVSRIGGKEPRQIDYTHESVFKEGNLTKIRKEKQNIERWEKIFEGLGPRIFSYQEEARKASLLVEFLPGCTLDEIILTAGQDVLEWVLMTLAQTVEELWELSKKEIPAKIRYVRQIQDRLEQISQVHPEFVRDTKEVGRARIDSTKHLLARCEKIEKGLKAPFSVFIHGDFNTNNIVYNQSKERVHFVDLSRSEMADYVQDGSVFLVSNFRMPVFEEKLRDRLNHVIEMFFEFLENFAREQEDRTFDVRMALGLARSFYTSTRFEMNSDFAKEMYLRAVFLLEKVVNHHTRPWDAFKLPSHVLYY
jgi:phosphate uptake regulator